jgi:hypothetical protein
MTIIDMDFMCDMEDSHAHEEQKMAEEKTRNFLINFMTD